MNLFYPIHSVPSKMTEQRSKPAKRQISLPSAKHSWRSSVSRRNCSEVNRLVLRAMQLQILGNLADSIVFLVVIILTYKLYCFCNETIFFLYFFILISFHVADNWISKMILFIELPRICTCMSLLDEEVDLCNRYLYSLRLSFILTSSKPFQSQLTINSRLDFLEMLDVLRWRSNQNMTPSLEGKCLRMCEWDDVQIQMKLLDIWSLLV